MIFVIFVDINVKISYFKHREMLCMTKIFFIVVNMHTMVCCDSTDLSIDLVFFSLLKYGNNQWRER